MNNKNLTIKKAFSLVEIMFVISIITFLSVSSVTYFNNFVDSKRIEKDTDFINNSIENLNYKVKNRECYDYEIIFSINNDYLTYKLNQTIKKTETNLIIDKNLKSFTMSTNLPTAGFWEIKIYSDNKKNYDRLLDQRNFSTGYMDLYRNYDIKSKLTTGEDLFGILYYSEDNLNNSGVTTNFLIANTKSDKSGQSTNDFLLKNINGKFRFYSGSTLWNSKEVYLFFEKGGLEKSIRIINN